MRVLVLGGGGFLGHHVVAVARAAGHEVTVFSRSGNAPRDDVEVLVGDRHGDLDPLRGREFDAVVDTLSDPDAVAATARLLSGSAGVYGYVSGMSVYHPHGPAVPGEDAPVRGPEGPDDRLQRRSLDKLACEQAVSVFDGPRVVVRVGVMVGPRDPSDRFTWWPVRLARALAGEAPRTVLAPGDPRRPVQYSDARDVAAFVVAALAAHRVSTVDAVRTVNTVGPGRVEPLAEVLDGCLRAAGGSPGDVELRWAGEGFLREALRDRDGGDEEKRPLWFPEDQIPQDAIDSSAALAAGLRFRPAEQTARDTLEWARGRELSAGFTPQDEQALIDAAARTWRCER